MKIKNIIIIILSCLIIFLLIFVWLMNIKISQLDNKFNTLSDSIKKLSLVNSTNNPQNVSTPAQNVSGENPYKNADIKSDIIKLKDNTYGYDIYMNGNIFIHQPNIPGMPGNKGFSSIDKAEKVADLIIKKLRNNIMPPSVTIDELNKLNVLK